MPPLANVPNVVKVAVEATATGQAVVNVFHVRYSGPSPIGAADLHDLNTKFRNEWSAHIVGMLATNYSTVQYVATDLTSATAPVDILASADPGTYSGPAANSGCAVIHWPIGRRYRGGHPRSYIGPLPFTALGDPVHLAGGYQGIQTTNFGTIHANINAHVLPSGATLDMVCVHYRSGGAPLAVPLVDTLGTPTCNSVIGSQRRRL